jgi:lysophospholipase L1-like esterase
VTRVLRNLLFSLVLALLVLGGLEVAVRVSGWPDPGLYDGDIASVWTLRAGLAARDIPFPERGTTFSVRTNSAGYRGAEPLPGAILCLGDSTTFGWGVDEEQAWPAELAAQLVTPTINGGVPGHSTVQGLATLDRALALRPRVVVLAYLVRDAERASAPDAERPPSRPVPPLALLRAVRTLRGSRPPLPGNVWRVSPPEYVANLRTLVTRVRAAGAEAWVLAFPMRTPAAEHLAALQGLADVPIVAPTLPPDAFFAEDPIHLTPAGNVLVAEAVAAALRPGGAP